MLNHTKSTAAFEAAKKVIPGGVNSPVRSFRSVGGNPPFAARGSGSKLYDLDGNEYIDYIMSYGPLLLGHGRNSHVLYRFGLLQQKFHTHF